MGKWDKYSLNVWFSPEKYSHLENGVQCWHTCNFATSILVSRKMEWDGSEAFPDAIEWWVNLTSWVLARPNQLDILPFPSPRCWNALETVQKQRTGPLWTHQLFENCEGWHSSSLLKLCPSRGWCFCLCPIPSLLPISLGKIECKMIQYKGIQRNWSIVW